MTDASEFDPRQFYAVADESGRVQIRWMDVLPAGWAVLGRLIYTQANATQQRNSATQFSNDSAPQHPSPT